MADKKEYTGKTDLLYLLTLIKSEFDKYVKAVNGKGLSEEDFTTALKTKLAEIEAGAEVNVQSDWDQTDITKDDYIKNKPTSMPASDVKDWAKADAKPTYGVSEITGAAPIASPTFTGIPKAPDYDRSASITQLATVGYVARELAKKTGIKFQKVASVSDLPTHGVDGVIYLVPKEGASNPDIYTEYYWVPDEANEYYLMYGYQSFQKLPDGVYEALTSGELEYYYFVASGSSATKWFLTWNVESPTQLDSWKPLNGSDFSQKQYNRYVYPESKGWTPGLRTVSGTPGFYDILGDTSVDLSDYVKSEDITEITETEVKAIWDGVFGS